MQSRIPKADTLLFMALGKKINCVIYCISRREKYSDLLRSRKRITMIDDQDLGFFANFLGIFIFVLVIAYHYVTADPKYEGN
ncbi:hypothetical protein ACOSP7_029527 [Xanthoceras sorbifolium]